MVCKTIVKSDALWPTHCASVSHKNVQKRCRISTHTLESGGPQRSTEKEKRRKCGATTETQKNKTTGTLKVCRRAPFLWADKFSLQMEVEPPPVELPKPFETLQAPVPDTTAPQQTEPVIPDGFFDNKKQEVFLVLGSFWIYYFKRHKQLLIQRLSGQKL